jgi:uncharacterized membrane protein
MQAEAKPPLKHRIESIDILRGAIMLIMAIDHCRDYFHLGHPEPTNLATTTPFLFLLRFATHFCAPTFVFLSGISAYLAGTRRSKAQLSAFLIKRGLWLMVADLVIITFATNLDVAFHLIVLQVLWVIGGSMVLLGLLVWAPLPVIAIAGVAIFFGHNIFDSVSVGTLGDTLWWRMLVSANGFSVMWPLGPGRNLLVGYALLPWAGVMLLGYVFGQLFQKSTDAAKRKKVLLLTGLSLIGLFVILRAFNIYGDPSPWSVQKTTTLSIISYFNVSKYPPSLLYLCITLGPALAILAGIEHVQNRFTAILIVYGNVPMFYYICHWFVIRLINLATAVPSGFKLSDMFATFDPPVAYGFSLPVVLLLWLIVIASLYFPCRWYGKYKKTHTQWWLSYL